MKIAIMGAGLQAQAMAFDIAKNPQLERLIICDIDLSQAQKLARRLKSRKVEAQHANAARSQDVKRITKNVDCVIGATTYTHNVGLTEACIAAGTHFCDLGGNVDVVKAQKRLSSQAKSAGCTIVPDCGLAPGMANILAYHWSQAFDEVQHLNIRVGGLPAVPKTTLGYQLVFSVEGLINEYIEDCVIIQDGKRARVPGMTGLEKLSFGSEFGELEAFYTSGGTSTLPQTLAKKVRHLDYKTIRYAGHAQYIKFLLDLGLFSSQSVNFGKTSVVPRQLTAKLLTDFLPDAGPDIVLVRIDIEGRLGGQNQSRRYDAIVRYDPHTRLSAMQQSTGFSAAIVAQMLASGSVSKLGTVPQELAIHGETFLRELQRRGIVFKEQDEIKTVT
ncbi:MAG: saccharopine dehydrogenase C-terminal domain-containing protein [Myxococcota bacterium]